MPTDLTVILEHRPGELARLGEITGEAGVSIRGLAAFTGVAALIAAFALQIPRRVPVRHGVSVAAE